MRLLLLALIGIHPFRSFAADVGFSGTLIRIGHGSISVKLADLRVIDARLPEKAALRPERLGAEYKRGDQVQVTCRCIEPAWEEETSRYQYLELTNLRLVRREAAEVPASRLDTPAGAAGAIDDKLERAREVNLEYAENLPNFVADETAKRYVSDARSSKWRLVDTIQTEITFKGDRAVRQQIRRNGKPWDRPFESLPGFKWYGGFGTEVRPVFDPQCPTTVEPEGRAELHGRQLLKYRFRSPADGCFSSFYFEYQRYNPARVGEIFIDDPGGRVIQVNEDAGQFPAEFEFARRTEEVTWNDVKIGDGSHRLPVAANFVILYSSGVRWRVDVEYKNHRHFEASTNLTFPQNENPR